MKYSYLIPLIHLGPISGSVYVQSIPLERLSEMIIGKSIKLEVIRQVILEGKLINKSNDILEYNKGVWKNEKVRNFEWTCPEDIKKFCYIETHINLISGEGLKSHFIPAFYVQYLNKNNKSFLSCGNYKYGDPRTIYQMEQLAKWIDGYPAININRKIGTTYSLVAVNPYSGNASLLIEIPELRIKKQIKVKSRATKIVFLDELVNKNKWTGQIFIHGNRRCINYLINHEWGRLEKITTVEHTDPYRAEPSYQARFLLFRIKIYKILKKCKNVIFKTGKNIRV